MFFDKNILTLYFYPTNKTLFNIKQVQIIDLMEYVIVTWDTDKKNFVMYMVNKK